MKRKEIKKRKIEGKQKMEKKKKKKKKRDPEIIDSEVETAITALKKRKSPGPDKITNEQIKYAGEAMVKRFVKIFNTIIKTVRTPREWKQSDMIIIYKKGDKQEIENYRSISLSPTFTKIFG